MTPSSHLRPWLQGCLVPFVLLVLALPAMGQALLEEEDERPAPFAPVPPENARPATPPPNRTVPQLPANLQPPPLPPNFRPPVFGQQAEPTPPQRPRIRAGAVGPDMDDPVGIINLPELGTAETLDMLEAYWGKPILRQQNLPATKVTFKSQNEMTRGEAIVAIESILALNGIAITEIGDDFLKAVPINVINSQVPPILDEDARLYEPSLQVFSKIFHLDFLTVTEAIPLIQPLMSQGNPLSYEKSGFLMITDSLVNLQRIEEILARIDQPADLMTEMLFFQLRNISAADLVRRLQTMQQGSLKNRLENNTTFDADERTNQLIIFTHRSNVPLLNNLVEQLDINVAPLTTTEIYNIKHADATEVVALIEEVVTGQKRARDEQNAGNRNARRRNNQPNQPQNAAAEAGQSLQFSEFLTIVADERANTIVASGTESDHTFLAELIEKIDTLLAQVRIEVVIAEVRLQDGQQRGMDSITVQYGGEGGATALNGDTDWQITPGNFYGLNFGAPITVKDFSIEAVLGAARTNSDVSILSAPTIVTTHNQEATISVGEDRPIVTGVTVDNSNLSNTRSNISYRKIGIELQVKPRIGSNGVIQLEIEQTVERVLDLVTVDESTAQNQPVVGTRSATSYVSVRDGEMIVLGGLQSVEERNSQGKMTFLGYVPVLGEFFTRREKEEIRQELLIFIRPIVVTDLESAERDARRQVDILEDAERIDQYLERGTFRRPEEPEEETDDEEKPPRRWR